MQNNVIYLLIYYIVHNTRTKYGANADPIKVTTELSQEYKFSEISTSQFKISVKASSEAHIALTSGPKLENPVLEIFLGTSDNHEWTILKKNQEDSIVKINTLNILNPDNFTVFWVVLNDSKLSVGYEDSGCPFLTWINPETFKFTQVGVRTTNSTGEWVISADPFDLPPAKPIITDYDSLDKQGKVAFTTSSKGYSWVGWIGDGADFEVKAERGAEIVLASTRATPLVQPYYRIILKKTEESDAEKKNDYEVLTEVDNVINNETRTAFWVRWLNGQVHIGYKNQTCPFLSWSDNRTFTVNVLGFRTLGVNGEWKIYVPFQIWEDPPTTPNELPPATTADPRWFDNNSTPIEITTYPGDSIHYFPVFDSKCYSFDVQAAQDVFVTLSRLPFNKPMIQYITRITIGGSGNTETTISRDSYPPDPQAKVGSQGILSQDEKRGFWICWNNSVISVGRKGDHCPLLSWYDPYPYNISHFGVGTGNGTIGQWVIYDPNGKGEPENGTTTQEPVDLGIIEVHTDPDGKVVHKDWDNATRIEFDLITENDATIELFEKKSNPVKDTSTKPSTDVTETGDEDKDEADGRIPKYVIKIGDKNNTKTSIEKKSPNDSDSNIISANTEDIVSKDEIRSFWIDWGEDGFVSVGKKGVDCPIVTMCDPDPTQLEAIGLSSKLNASGDWKLKVPPYEPQNSTVKIDETMPQKPGDAIKLVTYGKSKIYQYFPYTAKIFQFEVATKRDALIALSTYSSDADIAHGYEIIIGGWNNTKSAIRKTNYAPAIQIETIIPNIVSSDESRGFWIRWNNKGILQVGRQGEKCPFMSWCDPEPVTINFVGVRTKEKAAGNWKLLGMSEAQKLKLKLNLKLDSDEQNDASKGLSAKEEVESNPNEHIVPPSSHDTQACPFYDKAYLCIRKCVDFNYDLAFADKKCQCTCFKNKDKQKMYGAKLKDYTFWRLGAPTTRVPPWDDEKIQSKNEVINSKLKKLSDGETPEASNAVVMDSPSDDSAGS